MNIRKHHTEASVPAVDEREWQAQERALQAERDGTAAAGGDDALVAGYRAVSRALRDPLMPAPPPDFAASVARHVEAARVANEERLERVLSQVLVAVLGVSAGVVSVLYGREWLHAIGSAVPDGSPSWVVLAAACVGVHWGIERWRARSAAH